MQLPVRLLHQRSILLALYFYIGLPNLQLLHVLPDLQCLEAVDSIYGSLRLHQRLLYELRQLLIMLCRFKLLLKLLVCQHMHQLYQPVCTYRHHLWLWNCLLHLCRWLRTL